MRWRQILLQRSVANLWWWSGCGVLHVIGARHTQKCHQYSSVTDRSTSITMRANHLHRRAAMPRVTLMSPKSLSIVVPPTSIRLSKTSSTMHVRSLMRHRQQRAVVFQHFCRLQKLFTRDREPYRMAASAVTMQVQFARPFASCTVTNSLRAV